MRLFCCCYLLLFCLLCLLLFFCLLCVVVVCWCFGVNVVCCYRVLLSVLAAVVCWRCCLLTPLCVVSSIVFVFRWC